MEHLSFGRNGLLVFSPGIFAHDDGNEITAARYLAAGYHYAIAAERFVKRPLFQAIIHAFSRARDLKGNIVLAAHGKSGTRSWLYWDGPRKRRVQEWIDDYDGRAALLLLNCCNPREYEISSKVSIVIHSTISFNYVRLLGRRVLLRLYVPGFGYVEHSSRQMHKVLDALENGKV